AAANVILSRPFDSRLRRSLRAGSDGEGSQNTTIGVEILRSAQDDAFLRQRRFGTIHRTSFGPVLLRGAFVRRCSMNSPTVRQARRKLVSRGLALRGRS